MKREFNSLTDFLNGVKEYIKMNEDNAYLFTSKSEQIKQLGYDLKMAIKAHEKRNAERDKQKQLGLFD